MTTSDWIEKLEGHISTGFVESRTYEHSCREVVAYYQDHPEEQEVIRQALVAVVKDYQWSSSRQLENAAYLAVNLESLGALQQLVAAVSKVNDPSGDFATAAIAAIRSFPGNGKVRDLFLPLLFQWLKFEPVAHRAYEALCDLAPDDAVAYMAVMATYHRGRPDVVRKAVTHLYYREGDTERGAAAVLSMIEGFAALLDAVKTHPLFPDGFKHNITDTAQSRVVGECRYTVPQSAGNQTLLDMMGSGLKAKIEDFKREEEGRRAFRCALEKIVEIIPGWSSWKVDLYEQAHKHQWPAWAFSCISLCASYENRDLNGQRRLLIWEFFQDILQKSGYSCEVERILCDGTVLVVRLLEEAAQLALRIASYLEQSTLSYPLPNSEMFKRVLTSAMPEIELLLKPSDPQAADAVKKVRQIELSAMDVCAR